MSVTAPSHTLTTSGYLSLLYGENAPGELVVWTLEGKRSRWFSAATDLSIAAAATVELAKTCNVYIGMALQDKTAALAEAQQRENAEAVRAKRAPRPATAAPHRPSRLTRMSGFFCTGTCGGGR